MPAIFETLQGEVLLLKTAYLREGLWYVLREGFKYVGGWPFRTVKVAWLRLTRRGKAKFKFGDKEYDYFFHSYNTTWENSRAVEIPIIWQIVQENADKVILEIGNVLRHYFDCCHDVVDLFERYPGVINKDVVDFFAEKKYDLVVSISTFEHIGWDETPRKPEKLLKAIQHVLENILSPGGRLVITVPLGQNPAMERYLAAGKISFTQLSCMKQVEPVLNEWEEFSWAAIRDHEFSAQGEWCGKDNAFLIGIMQKPQVAE